MANKKLALDLFGTLEVSTHREAVLRQSSPEGLSRIRLRTFTISAILCLAVAVLLSPWENVLAQSVGPGGVPGREASGAVSSVFGRTGAVTAQSGDYTATQVTNAAVTNTPNTFTAAQTFADSFVLTDGGSGSDTIAYKTSSGSVSSLFTITDASSVNQFSLYTYGGDIHFEIPNNGAFAIGTYGVSTKISISSPSGGIVQFGSAYGLTDGWLQAEAIGDGYNGNTDLRGHIMLSSGAGSYTFVKSYVTAPTCVATDTTTAAPIKVTVTTTTLTLTGTGSDVLNYICAD